MRHIVSWVFLAVILLPGCQFIGVDPYGGQIDHERVWNAGSNGNYSYVVNRICFCVVGGRLQIEVVDYEIQSIVRITDGEVVPESQFDQVHTIEQMFDLIDEAKNQGAYKVLVEYADEGYPAIIDIDWIEKAIDDELRYEVSSVAVNE